VPTGNEARPPLGRGVFVTGTATGGGTTWVACALAAWLRGRGWRVGVAKPVETGWPAAEDEAARGATDAALLGAAAGDPDPLEEIAFHRLPEPLAPSVAAARAGVTIDTGALVTRIARKRAARDVLLVEGAGGLLVPIAPRVRMLELASAVALPVLVVAANRLGMLNHAVLTVERLASEGLVVAGVVLTQPAPGALDLAQQTNPAELRALLECPVLGSLPFVGGPPGGPGAVDALVRAVDLAALDDVLGLPTSRS
jgi:dethiobiotin synthetase